MSKTGFDEGQMDGKGIIKALSLLAEAARLCFLYGMILTTPAREIKKMKLRQIEKELRALKTKEATNARE